MLRRLLILMPGLLASSVALLHLGCGDDGTRPLTADMSPTDRVDAGQSADMAQEPGADLGAPSPEDDGYPANPNTGFELDSAEGPAARSSCYRDDDTTLECTDVLCGELPVCCVGATREGCCAGTDRVPSTLIGGTDCTSIGCLGADARAFGVPGPSFDMGLVTGGDATGDGGVVFDTPVDLRNQSVVLEAVVAPPTADCDDGCFETVALAILREAPPSGETVLVQPMAALRYSGANDRMLLEAGGEILHRFTEAPAATWRFEATPEGTLRVLRDGTEVLSLPNRVVPGVVYAAIVGRTRNPSASGGEAAHLSRLSIRVDTCDIPTGWLRGAPLEFTEAPGPDIGRPSLLLGDPSLLAFDEGGALRLYRQSVSGRFDPVALTAPADVVRDPELVDPAAPWVLALGDDGAVLAGGLADLETAPVLTWSELVPGCDGCERSSPTTATAFSGDRVLLFLEDGYPRLHVASLDGAGYVEVPRLSAVIEELTRPSRDERLTGVSLVLRDSAWHLHATYARGTRSLVRLFVSEELVVWRALGQVFGPSGEGFDALQVWSFAVANGRDEGALRAVYRGSDGVDPTIGTTTRPAP
ncbi:MAG: hypothetical protein JJ863_03405 [Deltaproteobacteria bacterium]|nr:hypothetical protein [Deltaproteobacteria bacterium]